MPRCRIHGEYTGSYCDECRDAEARAEEHRAEMLEKLDEATAANQDLVYKFRNPGDFQCPACKLITLKRGASRCPICHIDIEPDFWTAVAERERREEIERERERQRVEAENAAKEKERRETAWKQAPYQDEKARIEKELSRMWYWLIVYFVYLLPGLSIAFSVLEGYHNAMGFLIGAVPFLNWIQFLVGIFVGWTDYGAAASLTAKEACRSWFVVLFIVGVVLCLLATMIARAKMKRVAELNSRMR